MACIYHETKYGLGQSLFTIRDGQIASYVVAGVTLRKEVRLGDRPDSVEIHYRMERTDKEDTFVLTETEKYMEGKYFETPEELTKQILAKFNKVG